MGFAYWFMGGGEEKKAEAATSADKILAQNKEIYAKLEQFNLENRPWDESFAQSLRREGGGR